MSSERLPRQLGIAACLAVIVGILLPYVLVSRPAVATYYDFAPVRMEVVGLLAAIALVALLVWFSDVVTSPTLAGFLVIVGATMFLNTTIWVWTVPTHLVMELPTVDEFLYHRWALTVLTALVATSGLWYVVRLLPRKTTPRGRR